MQFVFNMTNFPTVDSYEHPAWWWTQNNKEHICKIMFTASVRWKLHWLLIQSRNYNRTVIKCKLLLKTRGNVNILLAVFSVWTSRTWGGTGGADRHTSFWGTGLEVLPWCCHGNWVLWVFVSYFHILFIVLVFGPKGSVLNQWFHFRVANLLITCGSSYGSTENWFRPPIKILSKGERSIQHSKVRIL
jgi:hypothetical protein